jgi:hypothetical protein
VRVLYDLKKCLLSFGAESFIFSLLSKNIKIEIHRNIIFPVVLSGCETWSLILREKHRHRVFQNQMLRRIFWPERDEVTGDWRRLHNEELHVLYCSPIMRWVGHVACMGDRRGAYQILVGRPEGNKPLGKLRHKWKDNIRLDLQEVGWGGIDWIYLSQDRDR